MTAYIITRDRLANLEKIIPRWLDQKIPVVLVVERSEQDKHDTLISVRGWSKDVHTTSPLAMNRGVGYARNWAVLQACLHGERSMIMSDDDMRPAIGSDMKLLLKEATKPGILGIGAVRSIHDRFAGATLLPEYGVILCPGGWGMQLFALNVKKTMALGNFDKKLDCWGEDHELMRLGIEAGIPWLVHCGVKCEAIGKRYEAGGLNSFIDDTSSVFNEQNRSARENQCRNIIFGRWPDYVSPPPGRPRMAWQRMLDDFIPNWKDLSALHGGEWHV